MAGAESDIGAALGQARCRPLLWPQVLGVGGHSCLTRVCGPASLRVGKDGVLGPPHSRK